MAKRKPMPHDSLLDKDEEHFSKALEDSSPLACALIVTSFLEQALMTLLSGHLVKCNTADNLFNSGNALGDLSKCAEFARCLGLINSRMQDNIKTIGVIRNIFAHSPEFIDFDHPSLQEPLKALTMPKITERLTSIDDRLLTPRFKFCWVAQNLYSIVQLMTFSTKRQEENTKLDNAW